MSIINELNDSKLKLLKLKQLESKLTVKYYKLKLYEEILNLLIESNNNNLMNETFLKYCKLNTQKFKKFVPIINTLFKRKQQPLVTNQPESKEDQKAPQTLFYYKKKSDTLKGDTLIYKEQEFISFFKKIFYKVKLTYLELKEIINLIIDYKELNDEKVFIYTELYKNSNNINFLELAYELKNNKDIENYLLNEYLNLNLIDKYFNLYIKINGNKLDSFNIAILKYLQNQKEEINFLQNEVSVLKDQQMIKFKNKYPNYDYFNIINIETPLNVKKEELFYSNEFETFGLKWNLQIYPKGDSRSNDNECAIFINLNSLQYKYENEEEKEISTINIKYIIDSINLNDNRNNEYNFTEMEGMGNTNFKQFNFIPIIKSDKQIFSVLIAMKLLTIEFK
ncbi:hypothetical protein ABK040_000537 [Willaertia magna]